MVEFIDGPAKGAQLQLNRIPVFLRVVIDTTGHVDALDLPTDRPRLNEKVYAYKAVENTQVSGFVCGIKRAHGCIFFNSCKYAICKDQPEDSIMRNSALWKKWVGEVS